MSTNNEIIRNIEDYPITMNAEQVRQVLGISRAKTYEVMHREDFPLIQFGKRMLVRRDAFKEWYEKQGNKQDEG